MKGLPIQLTVGCLDHAQSTSVSLPGKIDFEIVLHHIMAGVERMFGNRSETRCHLNFSTSAAE